MTSCTAIIRRLTLKTNLPKHWVQRWSSPGIAGASATPASSCVDLHHRRAARRSRPRAPVRGRNRPAARERSGISPEWSRAWDFESSLCAADGDGRPDFMAAPEGDADLTIGVRATARMQPLSKQAVHQIRNAGEIIGGHWSASVERALVSDILMSLTVATLTCGDISHKHPPPSPKGGAANHLISLRFEAMQRRRLLHSSRRPGH